MDGSVLNYYNTTKPNEYALKMPIIAGLNPDFDTKSLIENLKTYDAVYISTAEVKILAKKGIVPKQIRRFDVSNTAVVWGF